MDGDRVVVREFIEGTQASSLGVDYEFETSTMYTVEVLYRRGELEIAINDALVMATQATSHGGQLALGQFETSGSCETLFDGLYVDVEPPE